LPRSPPPPPLKDVQAKLGELQEDKILACVDGAIKVGKLTPVQRDWALKLGRKDISELNSYLATAPTFEGGRVIEGKPSTETSKLTEEERVVCSVMGWSEEDFLDQKKKEA
jgi:phage I-like protein